MEAYTLSDIYIYPVKSLAGIRVDRWPVDANGLRHDRKWMLIDQNNRFLSQRKLPKMALIQTRLTENELILTTPAGQQLSLPLQPGAGEPLEVEIWHDRCQARSISIEADQWFSDFLQCDCRLVYHPDDSLRRVDPNYANPSDQTAFSDGFPFLIVSDASLQLLNDAMQLNLSMLRFRPNLVVSGCGEYAEDSWREIRIGNIDFRLPKPCSRCSVPAIDPETALSDKEPLVTLNRLRKWRNNVYFGQNALHDGLGELAVGDSVQILKTGPKQPPLDS